MRIIKLYEEYKKPEHPSILAQKEVIKLKMEKFKQDIDDIFVELLDIGYLDIKINE